MSDLKNKLQYLIEGQVPDYLKVEFPKFVDFIKAYYQFLDQNREANSLLLNATKWSDVDLTLDMFVEQMRKQFAYDISPEALVSKRRFIKFINEYYSAKGSEKAAELFFRMMYDDTATVHYPNQFVLRASAGNWVFTNTLKVDTDYELLKNLSLTAWNSAPYDFAQEVDNNSIFDLNEKTINLVYSALNTDGSAYELKKTSFGCVAVKNISLDSDLFAVDINIPKTISVEDLNYELMSVPRYSVVWLTAKAEDGNEYVYGYLTQQLLSARIETGGDNYHLRDILIVNHPTAPYIDITNGYVRVTGLTTDIADKFFLTDYVELSENYTSETSNITGIISKLDITSAGYRFYIDSNYFAENYLLTDDYTIFNEFTEVLDNPRSPEGTGKATVVFKVGFIHQNNGRWVDNSGFISDVNKLQDNRYYQPFSYVVRTTKTPYEKWHTLFKTSGHAAGFNIFGELLVEHTAQISEFNITSYNTYHIFPVDSIKVVDTAVKSTSITIQTVYAIDYFAQAYVDDNTVGVIDSANAVLNPT